MTLSDRIEEEIDALNKKWIDDAISAARDCDFPEDFHLENGQYWHKCSHCTKWFTGYKRRVICKKCSLPKRTIGR